MNYDNLLTQDELYAIFSCISIQGRMLSELLNLEKVSILICDPAVTQELTSGLLKIEKRVTKEQMKTTVTLTSKLDKKPSL